MRCSSSYIKFYFTWVLDGWHSIKAQTSCFHEMKCSQIKLHLNKKKTRRNERSEMQSSSERIVSFVQVFLINMYTCFKSVFDSETQSNGIQENIKGWCWWIKIVLFCFFDSDRLISSFKFAFCLFINYANICTWIGKNSTKKDRSLGNHHVVWNWNKERKLKCPIVEQRPRPHYVHTYPDILNPQLFLSGYGFPAHVSGESCSFRIRYAIRKRVDAKSGFFFIHWRHKIESSSLPWIFKTVRAKKNLRIKNIRIRVKAEIFVSEKNICGFKNIRIPVYGA